MYETDFVARYLATRVIQNRADETTGITYEKAITNIRTSQEAIDYWLVELS